MMTRRPDHGAIKFSHLGNAIAAMRTAYQKHRTNNRLIMGDDGLFWMVSPLRARELVDQGYERMPES